MKVYWRAWNSLIRKFERATGTRCVGYDPRISVVDTRGESESGVQLPVWLVQRIVELSRESNNR